MKSRREFEASRAVPPRGKVIHRPVFTKLWVNGRASEDRDEWTEEVRAHCENCYDDKMETSEVQAERIRHQTGIVVGDSSKVGISKAQSTEFSAHARENDEEQGQPCPPTVW